jgi:hypothetical protein
MFPDDRQLRRRIERGRRRLTQSGRHARLQEERISQRKRAGTYVASSKARSSSESATLSRSSEKTHFAASDTSRTRHRG